MHPIDPWQPNSASRYLARLEEYKDTVIRLFPALPRRVVDGWSISPVDALVLGHFLESYPRAVVALDVGTFIGASAFCLAGHPKVSEVVSVDPSPTIFDELADKSDVDLSARFGGSLDPEPLKDLRVLDVARATLAEFGDEREKVRFREGVVGSSQVGVKGEPLGGLEKVEVPVVEPREANLVALVDGLHTREGVRADLAAIFDQNPHAIALLDDCRHRWGPFVQAGVIDFMDQAAGEHHFRLFGDLGPGLATSNLGIVYPDSVAAEVRSALDKVGGAFSRRLDPLRLLRREEELVSIVNRTTHEFDQARKGKTQLEKQLSRLEGRKSDLETRVSRLKKRNALLETRASRLEEHNAQLDARCSSRRYKLADTAAEGALRVPGLRSLLRRRTK